LGGDRHDVSWGRTGKGSFVAVLGYSTLPRQVRPGERRDGVNGSAGMVNLDPLSNGQVAVVCFEEGWPGCITTKKRDGGGRRRATER
jgi:hypothetical protein